jgi:hypothetical protein
MFVWYNNSQLLIFVRMKAGSGENKGWNICHFFAHGWVGLFIYSLVATISESRYDQKPGFRELT